MGAINSTVTGVLRTAQAACFDSGIESQFCPTIPDDILAHIFAMLESTQADSKILPELVLASHVARQWRDVALHTGTLWSRIYASPDHSPSMIAAYMRRSQQSYLHITYRCSLIDFDARAQSEVITPTWISFLSQSHRWQSLIVLSGNELEIFLLSQTLQSISVPHLRSLQLDANSEDHRVVSYLATEPLLFQGVESALFSGSAQALTLCKIRGISPMFCYPSAGHLTELSLHADMNQFFMTYDNFHNLLSTASNLGRLNLRGEVFEATGHGCPPLSILLPRLIHLDISADLDLDNLVNGYVFVVFSSIEAPNLETLVFSSDCEALSTRAFVEATRNGAVYPALRTLRLCDISFDLITSEFMLSTPQIQDFTIALFGQTNSNISVLLEGPERLWPCLQDLSVDTNHGSRILELVSARIALGHPLRSLHLAPQLVHGFDQPTLKWLLKNIELDNNFHFEAEF
ncbi:hypothetical protein HWV62_26390 [Athelia sp. TMB]|nr:hypothetical protein HWV62_26390 [Athelia sp. TMB]